MCALNELSFTVLTCPLADDGCCVTISWRFNRHPTLHLLSIRDDVSTSTLLFTHPIVPWWRFNQHSILRQLSNPDDVSTYTQLLTRLTVIWWRFNLHLRTLNLSISISSLARSSEAGFQLYLICNPCKIKFSSWSSLCLFLSLRLFVCLCVCLSVCLFLPLSLSVSVCLSVCLSVCHWSRIYIELQLSTVLKSFLVFVS